MPRLLAVISSSLLALAPAARADDTVLAPAPGAAGLTAYGGHAVFSSFDASAGTWSLMHWHDGVLERLPVPTRSVPFDADAGPDAQGRPVVVYSSCRREPAPPRGFTPAADWQTARGCDLYETPLTGLPAERRLRAASTASKSETTPSIWRGALAFARHRDGASRPAIEYLPAGATRPRVLGAGSVQACLEAVCRDGVEQLDLGPDRIAYLWRMTGSAGVGYGWELRSAALDGGRSVLLREGGDGGVCGFTLPSSPSVTPGAVAYLYAVAECEQPPTTTFAWVDPRIGVPFAAPAAASAASVDGNAIYWLRACDTPATTCELVVSPTPPYQQQPRRIVLPPASLDLVRSGQGYRRVTVAGGVRVLRPPPRVPCSPLDRPAYVFASAQWSRGRHVVRTFRGRRRFGYTITRSPFSDNTNAFRLVRCGDRARVTYDVDGRRVSFRVARARRP